MNQIGPVQAVYKVGLQVCFPMEVGDPLLRRLGNVIGDQHRRLVAEICEVFTKCWKIAAPKTSDEAHKWIRVIICM
jgi:hypothetical protein